MQLRILFYCLLLILVQNCSCQMSNTNIIQIDKFDEMKLDVNNILIVDKGIILGGKFLRIEDNGITRDSSFVLMSYNKNDWNLKLLGRGELSAISNAGNDVYAIKQIRSKEIYGKVDSSILVISNDSGSTWKEITTFPFYVRDIACTNGNALFLICRDQTNSPSQWFILKSLNGGREWDQLTNQDVTSSILTFSDNEGFYVSEYKSGFCKIKVYGYDVSNEINIKFSSDFSIDCFTKCNNSILVVGRKENKILLYSYNLKSLELSLISEIDKQSYVSSSVHCYNNIVSIVVNTVSGFGTKTRIIYSSDSGKSWVFKDIPIDHYFKPYYFYQNEFIGYSGLGRIQVIDINKQK